MRASIAVTALFSALAVKAANITVLVGDNNGLSFSPPSITAQVGDFVEFQFMAKNHSVTQSTFANPCELQQNPVGVDSGFMAVPPGATTLPVWTISIENATAPLWFFCAQTGHCQKGMVFSINAPPAKTFAMFQTNAMSGSSNTTTPLVAGGSGAPNPIASQSGGLAASIGTTGSASAPASSQTGAALRVGSSAAGALAVMALLVGIIL